MKESIKKNNKLLDIFFVIYIIILLKMTIFRGDITLFTNGKLNLSLFKDLLAILHRGYPFRFLYLFLGNIFAFVPLGVYLKLKFFKMKVVDIVKCGFFLSLFIEVSQYILGTGVTELDDLILNTFGTFIGAFTIWIIKKIKKSLYV